MFRRNTQSGKELIDATLECKDAMPTGLPKYFAIWDEDSAGRVECGDRVHIETCCMESESYIDSKSGRVYVVWHLVEKLRASQSEYPN